MDAQAPFNRPRWRANRTRAAQGLASADFLLERMREDVGERLALHARPFGRVLDIGMGLPGALRADATLARAPQVVLDEEALPFADASFDLAVSLGVLHWTNDLPGALIEINRALAPDGLFLGACLGGATLTELRRCLLEAEADLRGGAAARVAPMLDVRDAGGLLQRAGFAMPVADIDRVEVWYDHPLKLLADLRAMGETAALSGARPPLTRALLARLCEIYQARHARADGRVLATFEIIHMSGWAPAPGQPRPLRPGSAKARLADALGVTEQRLKG